MKLSLSTWGFGITGQVDHDVVREIAPKIESAGFARLWVNHAGGGDALASIAAAADVTTTLRFATGVVPVDQVPAEDVVRSFQDKGLDPSRVIIGIGASAKPSPLTTVSEAAAHIRAELGADVLIGALGPKMRRLGVRETRGLLLNWLTPDAARLAVADKDRDLEDAPDQRPLMALYIRTALGADHAEAMRVESDRYAHIPAYKANFERLGFSAMDAAVMAQSPSDMVARLAPYERVVDEPVLRAITANQSSEEFSALIDAAASSGD